MKSFLWNGLTLLPERAVWRDDTRTLFVADVHIGKSAHFRALGVPVPAGATRENLNRLDALIDTLAPRELVVLGDLFHAPAAYRGAPMAEFAKWRQRRASLRLKLVAGNHDARAGFAPAHLGLDWVKEPHDLDGLVCRHIPPETDEDGPLMLAGIGTRRRGFTDPDATGFGCPVFSCGADCWCCPPSANSPAAPSSTRMKTARFA